MWCFHACESGRHSLVRRPGPGQGNHGIASLFGSLRGLSRVEADVFLRSLGAEMCTTAGGYTRYTFSDSSEVWLRPNGEVVRLPQPSMILKARGPIKGCVLMKTVS